MASVSEQIASRINFGSIGKAEDLKKRILFTLLALIVYRIGSYIPLPGIDPVALEKVFNANVGGILGMFTFLICSLLAKVFLEAINYIEHYGLVRERGKPVRMRHSWNSNHFFSSIYLYNLTRHSDHHRNTNLKFWELEPTDKDAPMLPYGYLMMLYLALFIPYLYSRIMKRELAKWDQNHANDFERNLVKN